MVTTLGFIFFALILSFLGHYPCECWTTPRLSSRKTLSSALRQSNSGDDEALESNPLIRAGKHFTEVDQNVGDAVIRAGRAWTEDWSQVTQALDDAANAPFWKTCDSSSPLQSVVYELEDIATIEGCISVGPPSSIPNWISVLEHLRAAAEMYRDDDDGSTATDDDGSTNGNRQQIYHALIKTRREIELLIDSI